MGDHIPTGDCPETSPANSATELDSPLEVIANVLFIMHDSHRDDDAAGTLISMAEASVEQIRRSLNRYHAD